MMNSWKGYGRISSDVDLKFSQGGTAFANFTLAVDRGLSKEKKAEAQSKNMPTADFIRCKAFGKTAEMIAQYFGKGDPIIVEGRIQTGSYEKDGVKHFTTDVAVDKFHFVGGAKKEKTEEQFSYDTNDFEAVSNSEVPF